MTKDELRYLMELVTRDHEVADTFGIDQTALMFLLRDMQEEVDC